MERNATAGCSASAPNAVVLHSSRRHLQALLLGLRSRERLVSCGDGGAQGVGLCLRRCGRGSLHARARRVRLSSGSQLSQPLQLLLQGIPGWGTDVKIRQSDNVALS